MAKDYYQNLAPQERLDKVAEIINKGIYPYHQKSNSKIEESPQEKEAAIISKTKCSEKINAEQKLYLNEKILGIKETVEFLKISRTTLWRLRKHGELPYCMIGNGRLIRFKLSEILNSVETKRP
ncbi:DNA-binding protein [bacterium]|nr:MAG: DNA-binding protein [bacterium]